MTCLADVEAGHKQTSGNANSSGLVTKKSVVYGLSSAFLGRLLSEAICKAILAGTEGELRATFQSWADDFQNTDDPTYGTLIEDMGPRCVPAVGSKRCLTHKHPNWVRCKTERARTLIADRKSKVRQSKGR